MTDPKDMTGLVASAYAFALQNSDNTVGKVLNECGDAITTLLEEVGRYREALMTYLAAFDEGTGTVYAEPVIRAALQQGSVDGSR